MSRWPASLTGRALPGPALTRPALVRTALVRAALPGAGLLGAVLVGAALVGAGPVAAGPVAAVPIAVSPAAEAGPARAVPAARVAAGSAGSGVPQPAARVAGTGTAPAAGRAPVQLAPRPVRPGTVALDLVTVPPMPGARFAVDGQPVRADRRGEVRLQVSRAPARHQLRLLTPKITAGDESATFVRWWGLRERDASYRTVAPVQPLHRDLRVQVAFRTSYLVHFRFTDQASKPIDPKQVRVSSITFRSDTGDTQTVRGAVVRLTGARPKLEQGKIVARDTAYSVDSVMVDGSNVVDSGRQRFRPSLDQSQAFVLQLRSIRVQAHDFLFGYSTGSALRLTYPDGHSALYPFDLDRQVMLDQLARGTYQLAIEGAGYSMSRPVALSRSQFVTLRVVSYLDLVVVGVLVLLTLAGLLLLGGRWPLRRRGRGAGRPVAAGTALAVLAMLTVAAGVLLPAPAARADPPGAAAAPAADPSAARRALPVLAYYYIWFDPQSWDRAKIDYPALGRYSSDDAGVMRQHIRTAKAAGITGFLVSWKSTASNDRRLRTLTTVARSEHFTLGLVYQGLDFDRNPLDPNRVAADLQTFAYDYGTDPVFRIFDRPLVVWSGTWRYSRDQVARVVGGVRDRLTVLGSEKDVAGYTRIADLVDGEAYYWSSVDPGKTPGYQRKLVAMGAAVHGRHGLWIAPFAPGFDARLVGGTSVVDRQNGLTLQREYATALTSSPDALGLISWNEFSENTYVEPSRAYGDRYVQVLRTLAAGPPPALTAAAADSSQGGGSGGSVTGFLAVCAVLAFLLVTGVGLVRRRRAAVAAAAATGEPPKRRRHRRHRSLPDRVFRLLLGLALIGCLLAVVLRTTSAPAPSTDPPSSPAAPPPARYLGSVQQRAGPATLAAAGDIACPADQKGLTDEELDRSGSCHTKAVADLVGRLRPDAVLALGDTQYPNGSLARFQAGYDKTWGRFRSITHPAVGNHEYGSPNARGYFSYFGAAAGNPDEGWYSFDLAGWHLVALNSECDYVGGCAAGSAQGRWLAADLAAHPARCTLAFWHRPRFSSGSHGSDATYQAFWTILQRARADLVLSGHDHDYERFAPLSAGGKVDAADGIREFVVGTGGDSHSLFHAVAPGSQVRVQDAYGVLLLTLRADGYDWRFVSVPGDRVLDAGSGRCH